MDYKTILRYIPETGELIWKEKGVEHFESIHTWKKWNARYPGKVAGTNGITQMKVVIDGRQIGSHRIIWEMHYGPIPEGMFIDHINQNPLDNRLCNLRLATASQNVMNRLPDRNKSGYPGIYWHRKGKKWHARASLNGKQYSLGYFSDPEDAHRAYVKGCKMLHGEFFNKAKQAA